jgi:hypothetical protein
LADQGLNGKQHRPATDFPGVTGNYEWRQETRRHSPLPLRGATRGSVKLGTVKGTVVKVHWTFILILLSAYGARGLQAALGAGLFFLLLSNRCSWLLSP